MSTLGLLQALWHVVPWQLRRPAARDVTLLHDAEFQILLRELRYPPIRLSCHARMARAGSADSAEQHEP